jgi:hypothetical protein
MGRDSVVGIATVRRSIPAGGWGEARFSAPVQISPGAHLASYAIGTWPFPEVKGPGRGLDQPPRI